MKELVTHVHRWRHRPELRCLEVYEHIQAAVDERLNVMVFPLYHLLYSQIAKSP